MKFKELSKRMMVCVCIYVQGSETDVRWSKTMTWEEWISEGGPFHGIEDFEDWGGSPRKSGEKPQTKRITLCEGVEADLYVAKLHPIISWTRFRLNATEESGLQEMHQKLTEGGWRLRDKKAQYAPYR